MGLLGKHIDRLCREEPEVAERVLSFPMDDFSQWTSCYIGAVGFCRGRHSLIREPNDHWAGMRAAHIAVRIARKRRVIRAFPWHMSRASSILQRMIRARIRRRLYAPQPVRLPATFHYPPAPTYREVLVASAPPAERSG